MSTLNNGGCAFPSESMPSMHELANGQANRRPFSPGMSLRDYFAANAMQGMCANPGGPFQANDRSGWGLVNCTFADVANDAYAMADAMLKARAS